MSAADRMIAAAYDGRAAEYLEVAGRIEQMDDRDREAIGAWAHGAAGPLLDAGCGPGLWTAFLAERGCEVRGIDLSAEFVAAARARHPGLRFETGSFRELPCETASLGGILAWYSLIHTPPSEVPAVLAEFSRVLRSGGSILIGFFDGDPRAEFAHAVAPAYHWSAEALGSLLADAGFTVTARERRDRVAGEISVRPHGAVTAIRA